MDFGFLSEFWDAITAETADTVAWFQSIGSAVAGALGSVLVGLIHPIIDLILVLKFLISYLLVIGLNLLTLPKYLFLIGKTFIENVGTAGSASVTWPGGMADLLAQIPFWTDISAFIGIGIVGLFFIFTYNHLQHG